MLFTGQYLHLCASLSHKLITCLDIYVFLWKVVPNSTEPLGVQVLKSRGFFTQSNWYWIGFGALIGYTLLFIIGYILALTFLNREFHQP
jgi:hypothetical protein